MLLILHADHEAEPFDVDGPDGVSTREPVRVGVCGNQRSVSRPLHGAPIRLSSRCSNRFMIPVKESIGSSNV